MSDPQPAAARESRGTRVERAVQRQMDAHSGRQESAFESAIRNAIGLAATVLGTLRTAESMDHLDELAKQGKGVSVAAIIVLSVGVLLFVFGVVAVAPKPMLTFLRVLGLNGIADRLTALLPGGRRVADG
jgi:Flp pilus assembly protein TadB